MSKTQTQIFTLVFVIAWIGGAIWWNFHVYDECRDAGMSSMMCWRLVLR